MAAAEVDASLLRLMVFACPQLSTVHAVDCSESNSRVCDDRKLCEEAENPSLWRAERTSAVATTKQEKSILHGELALDDAFGC